MLKTCLVGLGLAAVAAVGSPGEEKKPKTKVLEVGAKVLQCRVIACVTQR